jgi:hypothetical protein
MLFQDRARYGVLTPGRVAIRIGFIDAPQIGPANMASKAMTAPTAIPTVMPFSLARWER